MGTDLLVNRGVSILVPAVAGDERTIVVVVVVVVVVVGVARGGTSIVAGALHALGLPMGDKCHAPVYEDLRLSLAFEGRSEEQFDDVVEAYNEAHSSWGWKRPSSAGQLDMLQGNLRNPQFIFVFRDLFSIANRNSISMKVDILQGLQKALGFISPEPRDYMDKTRITKARGAVNMNFLETGMLLGWARGVHHTNPVTVDVEVNGEVVASIEANVFREHLRKTGVHPTGECGCELDLKLLEVQPRDIINVRVRGDVIPLNKKPIHFDNLERWMTHAEWRAKKQAEVALASEKSQ